MGAARRQPATAPAPEPVEWTHAATDRAPGFWQYESSGRLRPVVERYLGGAALEDAELAIMRAYLMQWLGSAVWFEGEELRRCRADAAGLRSNAELDLLIERCVAAGFDPL